MPNVSYEFIEQFNEMESELNDIKAVARVVTDDLRHLAATLHTTDSETLYDNLIDIARHLEGAAGIYRKEDE